MSPRWNDYDSPPLDDGISFGSSSSSTYDRSSFSSATSHATSVVGPHDTPLSSPTVFMVPQHAFSDHDYYSRAIAPLPVPPPPPSPPQAQRVSALATFAAEQIAWLWFAPLADQRPTKDQLVPTEKFLRFCHEILATTQISHSVVILALLYIHRLKQRNDICGSPGSEFRTAIVGFMLANKTLDDNTYTARTWSDVSSLELKPLVAGEAEFLLGLDFRLHVTESAFAGWIKLLEGHVAARKEQLSSSRSARRRQGPGASPDRELLGLGLSYEFPTERRSSDLVRDVRRHSRGGADWSSASRQQQLRALPSLSSFSFPSTPTAGVSSRSFVAPQPTPLVNAHSPPTLRHPRFDAAQRSHTHTRSAAGRPLTAGFGPSKRTAHDAELLEPSPPLNKRLAPAATWLARSFSAGASPAPPRPVYVLPRGPPDLIHASHRLSSTEYSPPPPTRHPTYHAPHPLAAGVECCGFRHLADGLQPRAQIHKPESLAFYSLAAGRRQGLPRWTSTDPHYQYQYTPTPSPHPAYGPPPPFEWRHLPAPAAHAPGRFVKYANAGLPGVLWPSLA